MRVEGGHRPAGSLGDLKDHVLFVFSGAVLPRQPSPNRRSGFLRNGCDQCELLTRLETE